MIYVGKNKIKRIYVGEEKIKKVYIGDTRIYYAGNIVTYHVDTNVTHAEEVDADETVLSPKTFTPTKSGWTFVGWRQDTTASGAVLSSLTMDDNPIDLYAVFQQAAGTKYRYYNNGTTIDPTYVITYVWNSNRTALNVKYGNTVLSPSFTPTKSGYTFKGWSTASTSTAVNTSLTATKDMTLYAVWKYPDAVLLNSAKNVIIDWQDPKINKTLFSINTTLYPTHNVTAVVGGWDFFNPTIGLVTSIAYMDDSAVRVMERVGANNTYEVSGYVGTNGVKFTLSNKSGNVTGYITGSLANSVDITLFNVTGIGATVVG